MYPGVSSLRQGDVFVSLPFSPSEADRLKVISLRQAIMYAYLKESR